MPFGIFYTCVLSNGYQKVKIKAFIRGCMKFVRNHMGRFACQRIRSPSFPIIGLWSQIDIIINVPTLSGPRFLNPSYLAQVLRKTLSLTFVLGLMFVCCFLDIHSFKMKIYKRRLLIQKIMGYLKISNLYE